jgi:hypothetical protein
MKRNAPWQQGHFDGFCGIYSLINSIDWLCEDFTEDDCSKLFQHLVKASVKHANAALDGLDFEPLCEVADTVPEFLGTRTPVEFHRPFARRSVGSMEEYFDRLATLLDDRTVAIMGLGEPWDHWTVVTDISDHALKFRDSYGIKRRGRSAFALEEGASTTEVDYHETLLVRLTK